MSVCRTLVIPCEHVGAEMCKLGKRFAYALSCSNNIAKECISSARIMSYVVAI